MLFPWVGLLEQIRLADVFVHYDDVQFSKGSFTNRVPIKTKGGSRWMTVPLEGHKLGQSINEVAIKPRDLWQNKHLELLKVSFAGAPFAEDALNVVRSVYSQDYDSIGMLARQSMLAVAEYFGLLEYLTLVDVAELHIPGSSSERVLSVVKALEGTHYITGHGAKNYLNHELFESSMVEVKYMNYQCVPYEQLHGTFTPDVSSLDLIANCGEKGVSKILSDAVYWKDIVDESN